MYMMMVTFLERGGGEFILCDRGRLPYTTRKQAGSVSDY